MTTQTPKTHSETRKGWSINLPDSLPVFTLSGTVLMPNVRMPLNIFQPNHRVMIDAALGQRRLIGVIQPSTMDDKLEFPPLYNIGTVARIVSFAETEDGRYLVNLLGLCRFETAYEFPQTNYFRTVHADVDPFLDDLELHETIDYDRTKLTSALRTYFKLHGVSADWGVIENAPSEELVASLIMICPLEPNEKQALLESPTFETRVDLLITLLEMATLRQTTGDTSRH